MSIIYIYMYIHDYLCYFQISVVDRQHLMSLFTIFYENAPDSMKQKLTNPRTSECHLANHCKIFIVI